MEFNRASLIIHCNATICNTGFILEIAPCVITERILSGVPLAPHGTEQITNFTFKEGNSTFLKNKYLETL